MLWILLQCAMSRATSKIDILLVNVGTPSQAGVPAVRRYLREFLSDPRIIQLPAVLRWVLLEAVILPTRASRSAHNYQRIWLEQGSPLLVYSQWLVEKLQQHVQENTHEYPDVTCHLAMRYGEPNLATVLRQIQSNPLAANQAQKLLIIPLYPQYSTATTASVLDVVLQYAKQVSCMPEFHFISGYALALEYIAAIAGSVRDYWQQQGRGEFLLFSFHGLPKKSIAQGDPYYQQCCATAAAVAQQLQLSPEQWQLAFQSRFGYQEWLQPYCEETLLQLAARNYKNVDVVCPGFAVDCVETLEEIALTYAQRFRQNGGLRLNYIPALNDSKDQLGWLVPLIQRSIRAWVG